MEKLLRRDLKRIQRRQQAVVNNVLPRLPRKGGMDQRRFTMPYGVADDGITITHAILTG
jgi:cytidylate kinase